MRLLFTVMLTLLLSNSFLAAPKPILQTIVLDQKTVTLNSPILEEKQRLYFPLVELKPLLNFTISRAEKLDGYKYENKDNKLFVAKHSKEIWFNDVLHIIHSPTFVEKSVLYIDLQDLFLLLGYYSTIKDNILTLKQSTPLQKHCSNSLVTHQHKIGHSVHLPTSITKQMKTIHYKSLSFPLTGQTFSQQESLYYKAEDLLKTLGYKISSREKHIYLSYNEFTYTIPKNSRIWKGEHKQGNWNFLAENPVIEKGESLYFPLQSLFAFLDYAVYANRATNTIELLATIHEIEIHEGSDYSIGITSRHSLSLYQPSYSRNHLIKSAVIESSIIFKNQKIKYKKNPNVLHAKIKNSSFSREKNHPDEVIIPKKNTLLYFHLKRPLNVLTKTTSDGLSLSFKKVINSLDVKTQKDTHHITLSGLDIKSPKILKEKKKLIFDFPDTFNSLPQFKKIDHPNLKSIRSSQLSHNPLITRVVLDFNDSIPTYTLNKTLNTLQIDVKKSLPKPKKTVIAKAPSPPKKSTPKKKPTPKKKKKSKSLKNKIIIVDAGHGGADPGAIISNKLYEKHYTLDVAKKVKAYLEKEGAHVIMTRKSDRSCSLKKRIHIANKNKADAFVSIHLNSFKSPKVNGSESYYYKYKDKQLALSIQQQLKNDLTIKSNGIKRNRFFVLRHTKMPATLIEPLFLTNKRERELIKTESFRNKLAYSIFKGLENYFKKS